MRIGGGIVLERSPGTRKASSSNTRGPREAATAGLPPPLMDITEVRRLDGLSRSMAHSRVDMMPRQLLISTMQLLTDRLTSS